MHRSFIPILLATLGLILFVPSAIMPLFEWHISESIVGSASACNGSLPSFVSTIIGESLDLKNTPSLSEQLRFDVKSPQSVRFIEAITRNINEDSIPLFWLLLFLCGIYGGCYAIYEKRTVAEALLPPFVVIILLCVLINVGRLFAPRINGLWCLYGSFNAELSKIHYETLLLWLASLLVETGAIVVMVRQILKAIMRRNEPAQSVVG